MHASANEESATQSKHDFQIATEMRHQEQQKMFFTANCLKIKRNELPIDDGAKKVTDSLT